MSLKIFDIAVKFARMTLPAKVSHRTGGLEVNSCHKLIRFYLAGFYRQTGGLENNTIIKHGFYHRTGGKPDF